MNGVIRRKLMEAERPPTSIKQWYKHATNLDRHWRKSRRKENRLRGKWEQGALTPRQQEAQWQLLQSQVWSRRQETPQQ